jgi:hypothetical protein
MPLIALAVPFAHRPVVGAVTVGTPDAAPHCPFVMAFADATSNRYAKTAKRYFPHFMFGPQMLLYLSIAHRVRRDFGVLSTSTGAVSHWRGIAR